PPTIMDVSIPSDRSVRPTPGLRIHRRTVPPPAHGRLRAVDAPNTVLDLIANARSTDEAVGVLCDAIRARVAARSVVDALAERSAFLHRALILELLADVDGGVESPLEHRYHRDVERGHALPAARLQLRQ